MARTDGFSPTMDRSPGGHRPAKAPRPSAPSRPASFTVPRVDFRESRRSTGRCLKIRSYANRCYDGGLEDRVDRRGRDRVRGAAARMSADSSAARKTLMTRQRFQCLFEEAVGVFDLSEVRLLTYADVMAKLNERAGKGLSDERPSVGYVIEQAARFADEGEREEEEDAFRARGTVDRFGGMTPTLSDMLPEDQGDPNWPRPPGPTRGFLRLPDDIDLLLPRPDLDVYKTAHHLYRQAGELLRGYPYGQRLAGAAHARVHVVDTAESSQAAWRLILDHAKTVPFAGIDAECRVSNRAERDAGLETAETSRATYVTVATGLGHTVVYCTAAFRGGVREALGPGFLALVAGRNPDVPVFYICGVGVFCDERLLGVRFAYGADLRGLILDLAESPFTAGDFGGGTGIKTLLYMLYGETNATVFPSPASYSRDRDKMIRRYRTDPGPLGDVVPARNMYRMFRLDGTRRGLEERQLIYMALDSLACVGGVYADILRYLSLGRGRGMGLAAQVHRCLFDARRTFPPPADVGCLDRYYKEYHGRRKAEEDRRLALAKSAGARRRRRKRLRKAGREADPPEEGTADEYLPEEARASQEEVELVLADERQRQAGLPDSLEERKALARKTYLALRPAHWDTVIAKRPMTTSLLARIRRYSFPYLGQKPAPEPDRCRVCARHEAGSACEVDVGGFVRCLYPLCSQDTPHDIGLCRTLQSTCVDCSFKGHPPGYPCNNPDDLLVLVRCFLQWADLGRWTRYREERPMLGALSFCVGEMPAGYRNSDSDLYADPLAVRASAMHPPPEIPSILPGRGGPARGGGRPADRTRERREKRARQAIRYLNEPDNRYAERVLRRRAGDQPASKNSCWARRRRQLRTLALRKRELSLMVPWRGWGGTGRGGPSEGRPPPDSSDE